LGENTIISIRSLTGTHVHNYIELQPVDVLGNYFVGDFEPKLKINDGITRRKISFSYKVWRTY
jgi:hypothetical protein